MGPRSRLRSCSVSKSSVSDAENTPNTVPGPLSSFLRPAVPGGALGWGRDNSQGRSWLSEPQVFLLAAHAPAGVS